MKRAGMAAVLSILSVAACTDDVVYIDDSIPDAPRALQATYYAGAVTVSWELGPGWDGESFRVYSKRVSDSGWFFIAEVTSCIADVCVYDDVNVAEGVSYDYYVTAVGTAGDETASDEIVTVTVPSMTPPPIPDAPYVVALDNASFVTWGTAARGDASFSHYRVYLDDGGSALLLGETDSEGFLDLLAENGGTYGYFVSAVDTDGHESEGSFIAEGTPRPDFTGEWIYDYFAVPGSSGFRFSEDESLTPILDGDDAARHFRVETDLAGDWWLVPGPNTSIHGFSFATTALKCGPASDSDCVDVAVAPLTDYLTTDVQLVAQESYVLRVIGNDGQLHYGVIRVSFLGLDQNSDPIMIFDWAYQLQAGNPNLGPSRSSPAAVRTR